MKFRLKKTSPPFEMVDGPMAGRKYKRGMLYDAAAIPEPYRDRFEEAEKEEKKERGKEGKPAKGAAGEKESKKPGAVAETLGREG